MVRTASGPTQPSSADPYEIEPLRHNCLADAFVGIACHVTLGYCERDVATDGLPGQKDSETARGDDANPHHAAWRAVAWRVAAKANRTTLHHMTVSMHSHIEPSKTRAHANSAKHA